MNEEWKTKAWQTPYVLYHS